MRKLGIGSWELGIGNWELGVRWSVLDADLELYGGPAIEVRPRIRPASRTVVYVGISDNVQISDSTQVPSPNSQFPILCTV